MPTAPQQFIYSGDMAAYRVELAPALPRQAVAVARVTILECVGGEQTLPVGATVTILRRKLTNVSA